MQPNIKNIINKGETIAVALSGGADSMALIHYLRSISKDVGFNVIAINIEHGIRGEDSIKDSLFVKEYCDKNNIPLISYSVNAPKKAEQEKLSIEQAARQLRYECFYHVISEKKCNKVATAHHQSDNTESILLNLFRGSGLKGLCGIEENHKNSIIRPFLNVSKTEISEYVGKFSIPYVTDQTNLCADYTRNNLRLNIIPKLKEIYPDLDDSLSRACQIFGQENEYLDQVAKSSLSKTEDGACSISVDIHPAIFSRATILALKNLGVEKDWEKQHVDSVLTLIEAKNGDKITLPKGILAIREYDKVCIYKDTNQAPPTIPFATGSFDFCGKTYSITPTTQKVDLKSGLFVDLDKIPKTAVVRSFCEGDKFTKFGGGTKSLSDYFTDRKIPLRLRECIPVLANEGQILAIFGVAISEKVRIDENSKSIARLN